MVQGLEEAVVTCAECGLSGRLIRHQSTGVAIAAFADFEALCRKVVPDDVVGCPYWIEAQQAAIPHLKLPA